MLHLEKTTGVFVLCWIAAQQSARDPTQRRILLAWFVKGTLQILFAKVNYLGQS